MEPGSQGRGRFGAHPKLLIVCKVNRCRSPLAAAWAVRRCGWPEESVRTAGLRTLEGLSVHPNCSRFLLAHGLPAEHSSRQLRAEDCGWSDRILCMSDEHCDLVAMCYPEHGHKTVNLAAQLDKRALEDPVEEARDGATAARYMTQVCKAMEDCCAAFAGQSGSEQP